MDPTLYYAIVENNLSLFETLTKDDSSKLLQVRTRKKNSILHVAAEFDKSRIAEKIIEFNPSLLCETNSNGDSALHMAARFGCLQMVQLLINSVKRLNSRAEIKNFLRLQNRDKDTALHVAVQSRQLEIVKLLVTEDSQPTQVRNCIGESPLFIAVDRKFNDIARHIFETAPNCCYKGRYEMNVLHAATIRAESTRSDFIETLTTKFPSAIAETDNDGWFPLHYAAYIGNSEVFELLLLKDPSLAYAKVSKDRSAIHIAAMADRSTIIQRLTAEHPETRELLAVKRRTALHIAAKKGKKSVVETFLQTPILRYVINEKDKDGNTPFHLAAIKGDQDILKLLVEDDTVDKRMTNNAGMTTLDIIQSTTLLDQNVKDELVNQLTASGALRSLEQVVNPEKTSKTKTKSQFHKISENEEETTEEKENVKERGNYNLVVSTIIASITFSAIYNLPGGNYDSSENNHEAGKAILSDNKYFKNYMSSNSIAFGMSFASILLHFLASASMAYGFIRYARLIKVAHSLNYVSAILMLVAYTEGVNAVLPESLASRTSANVAFGFFGGVVSSILYAFILLLLKR